MIKILIFSILFILHPVHVSITSIDYNHNSRAFEVFVRMYFDDFILDSKLDSSDLQIPNSTSVKLSSREAVNNYIREKIIIKADDKNLNAKLKEIKLADNEINIYLDYPIGKKPGTVSVKSLIMTGLFDDQSNMVIIKVNGFEEGVKLSPELTEQTFSIK
jgi:hypothetical protein